MTAPPSRADARKGFACAITHVRNEEFFLAKWIAHYGAIVGRENLHVVIDGDDWEPSVDLTGISTEVLFDAPRRRIRNDRYMAKEMSRRANALRKRYRHVIRSDVDEYVVPDPALGNDWPDALAMSLTEQGYAFALGVDVVQHPRETIALDRTRPVLGQRRHGYVAESYTKPFVITRWNNWSGGSHRLLNRPVVLTRRFFLFHLALCDETLARERLEARGGLTQHPSFLKHQAARLQAVTEGATDAPLDFAEACEIACRDFAREPDGSVARRPRRSSHPAACEHGLAVSIPDRFYGLV